MLREGRRLCAVHVRTHVPVLRVRDRHQEQPERAVPDLPSGDQGRHQDVSVVVTPVVVALAFFPIVINVAIDVSTHAR